MADFFSKATNRNPQYGKHWIRVEQKWYKICIIELKKFFKNFLQASLSKCFWNRLSYGHIVLVFNLCDTKVISSNPTHGDVYTIQHYMIKFVSDLRQVSGFLSVLRFPPPIELTATI
jgi:hypothetical protein